MDDWNVGQSMRRASQNYLLTRSWQTKWSLNIGTVNQLIKLQHQTRGPRRIFLIFFSILRIKYFIQFPLALKESYMAAAAFVSGKSEICY